jgi:hypothetical protein
MPKTQRLIVACLALAAGIGIGWVFAALFTFDAAYVPPPTPITTTTDQKQQEIYTALKFQLETKGIKTDGLSPYLLLEHFPPVEESDFNGVEAIIGQYEITEDVLTYKSGEMVGDAAAADMSEAGFALFLKNYINRASLDITTLSAVDVAAHISGNAGIPSPDADTNNDEFVACTMDAKLCPDGSYVGRTGPNCEFAACPNQTDTATFTCSSEQRQAEACIEIYAPVCASKQVECVTTPCNPVPETYPNSCFACSDERVNSYTEGACITP